jgi:transcription factor C subunit 6
MHEHHYAMSSRRSRAKQPKSYRVEEAYSFLDDEDGSGPPATQTPRGQDAELDDGDDFMPDVEQEEAEDDFDDDEEEVGDEEEGSEPDVPTDDESVGRGSSAMDLETPSKKANAKRAQKRKATTLPKVRAPGSVGPIQRPANFIKSGGMKIRAGTDKMRSRGVADFSKAGGQEMRLKDLFGPATSDLKQVLMTRDYWHTQETLPVRGPGGPRRSFFETDEARDKDETLTGDWFAQTGKEAFASRQKVSGLSVEKGLAYTLNHGSDAQDVLLGAASDPQLHSLKKGSYISIAQPFDHDTDRKGWIFNLGARIQDAQWATCEEGNTQYLAVAVEQTPMAGRQTKSMENSTAPAFSATKPYAASVQIWAFEARKNGQLDASKQPRLVLVICADWGAPKQLRWCPVDLVEQATDGEMRVGLLAGIWSDGRLRVLDVSVPNDTHAGPRYRHISQAAFDVAFPNTIPTCLHWLSGTTLSAATSSGTLAIWTLTRPNTLPPSEADIQSPKPWFYKQISDTYILTLSSGWPSQPQYISVSTADGFARLYDIRSPNADTTASVRGRVLCITQAWHEHTQAFIMPDEHYILKHNPIRRFYHNIYSLRSDSSIVRVAASPVHPGVLVGGTNGTVIASNPVVRVVNTKNTPWQQNWFSHEWRGPVQNFVTQPDSQEGEDAENEPVVSSMSEGVATDPNSHVNQEVLSKPLVRITEGYKATQPGIQHSVTTKRKPENEISTLITVFEEKSAITALAWNPNVRFGTWAVAGMGDGLLRVEDVGV